MFFIGHKHTHHPPTFSFLIPMHENDCFFLFLKVKDTVVMQCYDHVSNAIEYRFMTDIPDIGLSQKN